MSLALDDLPRDPDRMLPMLQQMAEVIAQQNATIAALRIERDTAQFGQEAAQAEIEKLRLLIRQLQRGRFGRCSEKLDPDQLQLGLEDLEQTAAAGEAAQEAAASSGTLRRTRAERRPNCPRCSCRIKSRSFSISDCAASRSASTVSYLACSDMSAIFCWLTTSFICCK